MGNPTHVLTGLQEFQKFFSVCQVAVHTHRQGFQSLEQVEGVLGAHGRTKVPHPLGTCTHDKGLGTEFLIPLDSAKRGIGFG